MLLVFKINSNIKIRKEDNIVDILLPLFTMVTEDIYDSENSVLKNDYNGQCMYVAGFALRGDP